MWILPTYHRPRQVQITLDSIEKAGTQTPGLVFIDGSKGYGDLRLPNGWKVMRGEVNRGVCGVLNHCFSLYPDLAWYGFISDDSVVRTPLWDQKLLQFMDGYSIIHSNDGWRSDERIHGAVIFGGELLRALGWWVPPGLNHCFCDDVWEAIAEKKNLRKYVPDVMVEHLHIANGKSFVDRSYLKAYESFDADKAAFLKWKETDFAKAVERIYLK
jgi:hypothetical protein